MAWQDRDYHREGQRIGFGARLSSHSVITWLIALNIIVFVLDSILDQSGRAGWLSPSSLGAFRIDLALSGLQLWRWVTYQFLHADFLHILFNMFTLYFFGPMVEQHLGSRRFLAFYLLCGISGAFVFTGLSFIPGLLGVSSATALVGASGSAFGILAACAMVAPHQRVMLLFPPIPMQMRTLVLALLGIAALAVIVQSRNAGGEAAHLGGALLGFLLCKYPAPLRFADAFHSGAFHRMAQERKRRRRQQQIQDVQREEAEVDRILAKVKDHGLQSLSEKEKKTLQRATDRQRHAG